MTGNERIRVHSWTWTLEYWLSVPDSFWYSVVKTSLGFDSQPRQAQTAVTAVAAAAVACPNVHSKSQTLKERVNSMERVRTHTVTQWQPFDLCMCVWERERPMGGQTVQLTYQWKEAVRHRADKQTEDTFRRDMHEIQSLITWNSKGQLTQIT